MKIQLLLMAILLPALALFGCASPPTDQTTVSTTPPAPVVSPEPAVKPQPREVLKQMADYLRSLDRFTVRVEKTTELILPTDQRLHADQTAEIAIQKPNRLRVNFLNLSGGRQLFYDGKSFSLFTPGRNVYASATAPSTLDETLDLLEDRYRLSMPVADGVVCHHLAFQTPEVDWEIWIEDGPRPLPRRLLLTDKSVKGSPQRTAALSDWNLAPSFAADDFTFNPPPAAQKIKFLEAAPAARPAKAAQ